MIISVLMLNQADRMYNSNSYPITSEGFVRIITKGDWMAPDESVMIYNDLIDTVLVSQEIKSEASGVVYGAPESNKNCGCSKSFPKGEAHPGGGTHE